MRVAQKLRLPLSALLSQALVAFTVELDNEFEHQMPHRTTEHGSVSGSERVPWLVSMAMWVHCMRYVPVSGITAGELARRSRLGAKSMEMVVKRMSRWWGYLAVNFDPAETGAKAPPAAWLIRPTRAGRLAQRVWAPLPGVIEDRWRARFGAEQIEQLRGALAAIVSQLDVQLPDYLPIGSQARAWRIDVPRAPAGPTDGDGAVGGLPIWALLAKLLLAFAIDSERGSVLSQALSANVVRVLDAEGMPIRQLRALTGLADVGIENSPSILEKRGYVTVSSERSGGRVKLAGLTAKGRQARDSYGQRVAEVEHEWEARFGKLTVEALRKAIEPLVGDGTAEDSPLFAALDPYPDGWRSKTARPETLPHHPMVSHRGGFPDGS